LPCTSHGPDLRAVNPGLEQFVRDSLARGIPRDDIRRTLAEAGCRTRKSRALSAGIQSYFIEYRMLPDSLELLSLIPGGGMSGVHDPLSGRPYEYRTIDSVRYESCASLDRADSAEVTL
jgi:hypothetical protein